MEKYLEDFICDLQEAAEAAGKDFDPATRTELELRQLWELYTEEGVGLSKLVGRHQERGDIREAKNP